jgi:hypothetical protein
MSEKVKEQSAQIIVKCLLEVFVVFCCFFNYCLVQMGASLCVPLSLFALVICLRSGIKLPSVFCLFVGVTEDILLSAEILKWTVTYCIVSYVVIILPMMENRKVENILTTVVYGAIICLSMFARF